MSRITCYLVVPFFRNQQGDLLALKAEQAPTRERAIFRANAMIGPNKGDGIAVGAIAFSRTGNPDLGDLDDGVILARFGETGDDIEGME
ncbi:hypothetical protein LMIY3S_03734 [Labrys miyagiensis]